MRECLGFLKSRLKKNKHDALFGHFVFHDVRKKPNENTRETTTRDEQQHTREHKLPFEKKRERKRDHERGRRRRRKKRVSAETFTFRRIRSVVLKSTTFLDDFVPPFGVQSPDESFPSRGGNDFHQHHVEEDNKEDEEEKNERRYGNRRRKSRVQSIRVRGSVRKQIPDSVENVSLVLKRQRGIRRKRRRDGVAVLSKVHQVSRRGYV